MAVDLEEKTRLTCKTLLDRYLANTRLDWSQAGDCLGRSGTQIGRTLKDINHAVTEKKTEPLRPEGFWRT